MSDELPYAAFAERLLDTGIFTDPWLDGRPRFRQAPLVLDQAAKDRLYRAAEQAAAAYNEACRIVDAEPEHLDTFFKLTPVQKLLWDTSRPFWHGIARADIFVTDEGPAVCELNCDTPTGEPEAVLLGALAGADERRRDPNAELGQRFTAMIAEVARRGLDEPPEQLAVGLVYPTELTEDLSVIRLYRRWFEERGWAVALGSPYNLSRDDEGRVRLFDTPCQVIVRHYKTDWWGERRPVWLDDDPVPDAEPLGEPLMALLRASLEGACVVVNPFGSVLPQNKRMMAFFWEHLDLFSRASQAAIRRLVPYTCRLEALRPEQLAAEREQWVLKSDYGAEGDEVILGPLTPQPAWEESLKQAAPGRWVAQRYFQAHTLPSGEAINHGVFVVAGEASGLYARAQAGATDAHAQSVPVLIDVRSEP